MTINANDNLLSMRLDVDNVTLISDLDGDGEDSNITIGAFRGAQGVGTSTRGGAFGTVYIITTLNDSGVGSLREAVEATGPRFVVFEATGIINLVNDLIISNPFISIMGQTSPGGIIVAGRSTIVNTNDFVIRHIRFRTGIQNVSQAEKATLRALEVTGPGGGFWPNTCFNGVVNQCSFSWSADQTLNLWNDAYDITFSANAVTEPLTDEAPETNHGYNFFAWGKFTDPSRKYSFHHNFTSHSQGRNPELNFNGMFDLRNNVNYNTQTGFGLSIQPIAKDSIKTNVVGNFNKFGPSTTANDQNKAYVDFIELENTSNDLPSAYPLNNIGEIRTSDSDPEENAFAHTQYTGGFVYITPPNLNFFVSEPHAFPLVTTSFMNAVYAQQVVNEAGATRPVKDAVDIRVALDFQNGTGQLKATSNYPADWPDLVTGAPPIPEDTNRSGIPNDYEVSRGFAIGTMNPIDPSPEGPTWIETYCDDLDTLEYTP